ncbi:MAG: hypothetical protein JWR67_2697 [Mucilaginibacter sp.]|nr:hypothetical protein [Mucilaginibacter sp.]
MRNIIFNIEFIQEKLPLNLKYISAKSENLIF